MKHLMALHPVYHHIHCKQPSLTVVVLHSHGVIITISKLCSNLSIVSVEQLCFAICGTDDNQGIIFLHGKVDNWRNIFRVISHLMEQLSILEVKYTNAAVLIACHSSLSLEEEEN